MHLKLEPYDLPIVLGISVLAAVLAGPAIILVSHLVR
jgi:hypothetical protein